MKYLKADTKLEKSLEKVENLMRDLGISLVMYGGNGFVVKFEGIQDEFWVTDQETGERISHFPRFFECERLALRE